MNITCKYEANNLIPTGIDFALHFKMYFLVILLMLIFLKFICLLSRHILSNDNSYFELIIKKLKYVLGNLGKRFANFANIVEAKIGANKLRHNQSKVFVGLVVILRHLEIVYWGDIRKSPSGSLVC